MQFRSGEGARSGMLNRFHYTTSVQTISVAYYKWGCLELHSVREVKAEFVK